MKYYFISGEASGDLHASNLLKALQKIDPQTEVRAWGGDLLQQQGAYLVKHYKELAFMGFTEVLMNLRTILRNMKFCLQDILNYQPDAVVLIDYPGFNLRIAQKLKKAGYKGKIIYYISPQVWAWKQSRVKIIKQVIDKMFVILPFEKDFYKQWNYEVEFVGHPLMDAFKNYTFQKFTEFISENKLNEKPIIALLPGSRKQEINIKLPVMLAAATQYLQNYQVVVACAPGISREFYNNIINEKPVSLISGKTYQLLNHARAALVTSGTATLETAILKVPQVVCYKGSKLSYLIARKLVKVKYISLVNLIMNKAVVRELIQDEMNLQNLKQELHKLLHDEKYREMILQDYEELRIKLGKEGASENTAKGLLKTLGKLS